MYRYFIGGFMGLVVGMVLAFTYVAVCAHCPYLRTNYLENCPYLFPQQKEATPKCGCDWACTCGTGCECVGDNTRCTINCNCK